MITTHKHTSPSLDSSFFFFTIINLKWVGREDSVRTCVAERELCFKLELCAEMALVLDDRGYLLGCLVWVSAPVLAACQISLL